MRRRLEESFSHCTLCNAAARKSSSVTVRGAMSGGRGAVVRRRCVSPLFRDVCDGCEHDVVLRQGAVIFWTTTSRLRPSAPATADRAIALGAAGIERVSEPRRHDRLLADADDRRCNVRLPLVARANLVHA